MMLREAGHAALRQPRLDGSRSLSDVCGSHGLFLFSTECLGQFIISQKGDLFEPLPFGFLAAGIRAVHLPPPTQQRWFG
jgi:hypothetical protein